MLALAVRYLTGRVTATNVTYAPDRMASHAMTVTARDLGGLGCKRG